MTGHDSSAEQSELAGLVEAFHGDQVAARRARRALVAIGEPAVPLLLDAVRSQHPLVRWEAAKALAEIGSPSSIDGLIGALGEEDGSVRWIAAEGLANIGLPVLAPLFRALLTDSDNAWLRDGAHHVLRWLSRGQLGQELMPILRAIESWDPAIPTMRAAAAALERMRNTPLPDLGGHFGGPFQELSAPRLLVSRVHVHSGSVPWRHLLFREVRS